MQLVFLLIFLVFIFLNIILGLVSSWKKRKRLAADIHRQEETAGQESLGPQASEELYEEQRVYEKGGRFTENPPGAGRPVKPQSVAEELSGTHPEKPPDAWTEKPSQPSVLRDVFPMTQNISFLHEQTAANIPAPQYTFSEELPPEKQEPSLREKPSEPQEQMVEISSLRSRMSDTSMPHEAGIKRHVFSPVQKLEEFPPLKRAIVFSEILGPPKGLSNF